MCRWKIKGLSRKKVVVAALTVVMVFQEMIVQAQSGKAGIEKADSEIRTYFASGEKLMYAVGAVIGLIGAVKVYQKWSSGDQDTSKVAAAWLGSCIFLVVVATILKSFFNV